MKSQYENKNTISQINSVAFNDFYADDIYTELYTYGKCGGAGI